MSQEEKLQKVVKDFSNACNSFGVDPEPFIKAFCLEHRTLQQGMFGVIAALIGFMASDEYRTDGRNHYSKEMAKAFLGGLRNMYENREREYYEKNGYSTEEIEEKMILFRKKFDEKPEQYLNLPCI
jgi:hypothetical protein